MKKLIYCALALAAGLFATSCMQENLEPVQGGSTVTYTVNVPEVATKAIGDGSMVDQLVYAVYRIKDNKTTEQAAKEAIADANVCQFVYQKTQNVEGKTSTIVPLELINNQRYIVLFWAQNTNAWFDVTKHNLGSSNIAYPNDYQPNNDKYDAFTNVDYIEVNSAASKNITLTRPFGQLNIATNRPSTFNAEVYTTKVSVMGLAHSYNVATKKGSVTVDTPVAFAQAAPLKDAQDAYLPFGNYARYISMNYVFVEDEQANVAVTYDIETTHGKVSNTINSVPVKKNYKTNIVGSLLTSNVDYNVTLEKGWGGSEDVMTIVDGLVKIQSTGEYMISNANGLAHASKNCFANGGSYILTADIDMSEYTALETKAGGKVWEPVEISHKTFSFDGKGHTIRNLPGMFVRYTICGDLTIKNLTLNNPKIAYDIEDKSDKGVGAFFGFCDAFNQILLENCHVKGGEIAGGHWTGGLIGYAAGHNAEGVLTIKNCSVKDAKVTGKASCGGIIGHANGGTGLAELNTISVFSTSIESTGTDTNKAGSVMGTVGSGTVKVTDCSVIDNEVTSNGVSNTKLWGRQGSSTGVLYVDGVQVEDFGTFTPSTTVTVTNDAELAKVIEVKEVTTIKLATGTYSDNIVLTVAAEGDFQRDIKFEAVEGASPVIAGTVTLGYRNQGVAAAKWDGNITFEGITFDHANPATHSLDVQDVESLKLTNCTIIGDGEYGIGSARGNATGTSRIEGCTFVNAAMQLLGNFATGLVIDGCTFNESRINVQAGNGVTVQNCTFNNTLKSVHFGDSFYCVRSNSTPITVKNSEINIDSELAEVAANQAKWGLLWNRGTTNWTLEDVAVTLTDAALMQTELLVTKCTSTGTISNGLIVNGVHAGVSQNAEGVWEVDNTASGALTWLQTNNPEVFQNGTVQYGTALYTYSNNGANVNMSAAGENAKTVRYLVNDSTKDVIVSEGIKIIGDRTFRDAPNMKTISLPSSLTTIENDAFQKAYALEEITIPENVTSIGSTCFGACSSLEKIIINAKNITFHNYCARACANLKEVFIYSEEIEFGTGSMYFTNKENADASAITFYVKNQVIADKFYAGMSTSHSYGMKIVSLDGQTTYYNTLK